MLQEATGGSEEIKQNANQTIIPLFIDPGYDYGLVPGFPGDFSTDSSKDKDLAKRAMGFCDDSMSLMTGPELSLGTLRSIAAEVEQGGLNRMPGYCVSNSCAKNSFVLVLSS